MGAAKHNYRMRREDSMAFFEISFFSQALNRSVRCNALLPVDQGPYRELVSKPPLKTLYLLHGMTCSSDSWADAAVLQDIVRTYHLAVIMPSGENSFYCDSALTGNRYGAFIAEELVNFTRDCFPLSGKREDTFIGGLSMGGFGAAVNGLRHPETFGYITMFSAALIKKLILRADDEPGLDYFTRRQYQTMFGLERIEDFSGSDCDYEALAERLAASGKERPAIYMDCGTEDVSLYRANRDFKDRLIGLGYDVTWDSRPGGHDMRFWNDSLRKAMAFLPVNKLAYAADSPAAERLSRMNRAMVEKMAE